MSALNEQRQCYICAKTRAREIVDKAREARPKQEKEKGDLRKGRKGRDRLERKRYVGGVGEYAHASKDCNMS